MREPVRRRGTHATYSDEQLRIATIGVSGGRWLTRGRFATPAEFLSRIVARVEGYTYDAIMWDVSIVQAPFSVAPCQTLMFRFATFLHRCVRWARGRHRVAAWRGQVRSQRSRKAIEISTKSLLK